MTDCPDCGYHDPFMRSYWDHEKEVAEPIYFREWDREIWNALLDPIWGSWVECEKVHSSREQVMYHLVAHRSSLDWVLGIQDNRAVERWSIYVLMARKEGKVEFERTSQRKNWQIKGKLSA